MRTLLNILYGYLMTLLPSDCPPVVSKFFISPYMVRLSMVNQIGLGNPGQPGSNGVPAEPGLNGNQGPAGAPGDKGPQGLKGLDQPQGAKGIAGAPGSFIGFCCSFIEAYESRLKKICSWAST